MLAVLGLAAALVLSTVLIHYESLRLLDWLVLSLPDLHKLRVAFVVLGCFCAHLVEALIFAFVLYHAITSWGLGEISGEFSASYSDFIYLSIVSYTSLGIGDMYPLGAVRMLVAIESLIGLMMIAWSATFTYLEMEQMWQEDGRRLSRRKR